MSANWSLDRVDLVELDRLAQLLALVLKPGDVIAVSGPLCGGKKRVDRFPHARPRARQDALPPLSARTPRRRGRGSEPDFLAGAGLCEPALHRASLRFLPARNARACRARPRRSLAKLGDHRRMARACRRLASGWSSRPRHGPDAGTLSPPPSAD